MSGIYKFTAQQTSSPWTLRDSIVKSVFPDGWQAGIDIRSIDLNGGLHSRFGGLVISYRDDFQRKTFQRRVMLVSERIDGHFTGNGEIDFAKIRAALEELLPSYLAYREQVKARMNASRSKEDSDRSLETELGFPKESINSSVSATGDKQYRLVVFDLTEKQVRAVAELLHQKPVVQ